MAKLVWITSGPTTLLSIAIAYFPWIARWSGMHSHRYYIHKFHEGIFSFTRQTTVIFKLEFIVGVYIFSRILYIMNRVGKYYAKEYPKKTLVYTSYRYVKIAEI